MPCSTIPRVIQFSESYIKVSKNMKIEGCALPKFIKSCLQESMIYTSEHMTIKHCPSNKSRPF